MTADAAMVHRHRSDIAAALHKAENVSVRLAAETGELSFAGIGDRGFVCFYGLAGTAKLSSVRCRGHRFPNPVAKKPSGFHAAIEHPLNLARRDAFLRTVKQVDDLQPQMQGKVAILENRPHANREWLFAGIALVQARTGRLAVMRPMRFVS
jgi:hypothetical protein